MERERYEGNRNKGYLRCAPSYFNGRGDDDSVSLGKVELKIGDDGLVEALQPVGVHLVNLLVGMFRVER